MANWINGAEGRGRIMLSEVTGRAIIVIFSLLFRAIMRLGRHQRCHWSQDANVSINQCRVAPFLPLSLVYDPF